MSGVLAQFRTRAALVDAVVRLRAERLPLQTYTPVPLIAAPGTAAAGAAAPGAATRSGSPLPLIVLAAGVVGAGAAFGMQVYAVMISYPQNIGGRPPFSWPSFIPIAFEVGALCAVLTAFGGFLVACRLPKLYDPIDECDAAREALWDGWLVAVRSTDPMQCGRFRELCRELGASRIEDIPA